MGRERYRRSWIVIVALVVFAVALPAAAQASGPPLLLLGSDTLSVTAKQHATTATAFVSILNKGTVPVSITVKFSASSRTGVAVDPTPQPALIDAGEAQRVKVTFTGLTKLGSSVDGELVVT